VLIEQLGREWKAETALGVVSALAQRNDLPRVRPLVLRLVREDLDLAHPETLEALGLLAYLEDADGRLSSETADLVASILPRFGDDPRRAVMATYLAHEFAHSGEANRARALVDDTLGAVGAASPMAPDLLASLGQAQRKAGRNAEAEVTLAKALKAGESAGRSPAWAAEWKIDLAAVLAADSKKLEAEATLQGALPAAGNDVALLTAGTRVWLTLKKPGEASDLARSRSRWGRIRGPRPPSVRRCGRPATRRAPPPRSAAPWSSPPTTPRSGARPPP
jgi:hypothetical protein